VRQSPDPHPYRLWQDFGESVRMAVAPISAAGQLLAPSLGLMPADTGSS